MTTVAASALQATTRQLRLPLEDAFEIEMLLFAPAPNEVPSALVQKMSRCQNTPSEPSRST
jgi:hypothetical protein